MKFGDHGPQPSELTPRRTLIDWIFKREDINGHDACPVYMYRWRLLRLGPFCAVYLHHFIADDWSREFHDHPKRFISIGLKGSYIEETPARVNGDGEMIRGMTHTEVFYAPWIRSFPAEHRHRLRLQKYSPGDVRDCWTLVIVLRKEREWGFWHPASPNSVPTFVPWYDYVNDMGIVEAVKSCD